MIYNIKRLAFTLLFGLIFAAPACAKDIIAILSDELKPVSTNYVVFGEPSNLISQELANLIKIHGKVDAFSITNSLTNTQKENVKSDVTTFLREYKSAYTINYPVLKNLAAKLDAKYILLITSGIDVETLFLKETFWNKIPIAGENSVRPSYRLITQMTLIDPERQMIMLSKSYDNSIVSKDFDLATPAFSPSYAQLNKVQELSTKLAKDAAPLIAYSVRPELRPKNLTLKEKVDARVNTIWHDDPIYADDINYINPPQDFKTKLLNGTLFDPLFNKIKRKPADL